MAKGKTTSLRLGLGVPIGILLAFAIVIPGLTQEAPPSESDPGRDMAESAGCDMSKSEVAMEVAELDYMLGYGSPTIEEAVLSAGPYLAKRGVDVPDDVLARAASDAETSAKAQGTPIEVRLPGASLVVSPNGDAFVFSEVVTCA